MKKRAIFLAFLLLSASTADAQLYFRYDGGDYGDTYNSSSSYYAGTLASPLSVSCAPMEAVASTGQTITWYTSTTGGGGRYQYTWSGTDGLFGTQSTVQKSYTTPGDKFATVTVVSEGQSVIAGCVRSLSIVPAPPLPPRFGASCYATPERITPGEATTWLAVISGAKNSVTYEWDGTDNLTGTGPAVFKTYTTNGLKHALLTVTSGNERIAAVCSNTISVGPRTVAVSTPKPVTAPPPLSVSCAPAEKKAKIGEEVRFEARASGGTGVYNFTWQGDEELSGNTASATKIYKTEGTKNVSVTVSSGATRITATCTPEVEVSRGAFAFLAAAFLSLFGDVFCIILAILLAIVFALFLAERKKRNEAKDRSSSR